MSLVITLYVREGIVMASDSRLSINSQLQSPNGSSSVNMVTTITDSNTKIFMAFDRIGISTFGQAAINGIPVAGFIESFIHLQAPQNSISVKQLSHKLLDYFCQFNPIPDIGFHVGGYDQSSHESIPLIYRVVPTLRQVTLSNPPQKGEQIQGASWDGEGDTLARLIQPVSLAQQPGTQNPLPHYPIPWQIFTLQDAIDFAVFAIDTTIKSFRFQSRPKTVGGPIDVMVIKPQQAK